MTLNIVASNAINPHSYSGGQKSKMGLEGCIPPGGPAKNLFPYLLYFRGHLLSLLNDSFLQLQSHHYSLETILTSSKTRTFPPLSYKRERITVHQVE